MYVKKWDRCLAPDQNNSLLLMNHENPQIPSSPIHAPQTHSQWKKTSGRLVPGEGGGTVPSGPQSILSSQISDANAAVPTFAGDGERGGRLSRPSRRGSIPALDGRLFGIEINQSLQQAKKWWWWLPTAPARLESQTRRSSTWAGLPFQPRRESAN